MIKNKLVVQIKNGREKVGVNFTGVGKMKQNEEGLIYFNEKEPIYFDFIDYSFDGPNFNTITQSKTKGKIKNTGKDKTKKKGKAGKVIGGAALGALTLNPVGIIVGAVAGASSKGKSETIKNGMSENNVLTSETQKQVEIPSTANIMLRNINTNEDVNIMIVCDSIVNSKLSNFQKKVENKQLVDNTKSIVDQLKDYKELLELEIITQEDFDSKKKELLGL